MFKSQRKMTERREAR